MKQTVFRYGLYAGFLIVVLVAIQFFLIIPNTDYSTAEVTGYLTIVLSMIFIYFGIRHYRDHHNGGSLSFGEGLKVGLLIALVPAAFFGLFDLLYTEWINPAWQDDYYQYQLLQIRESAEPAKIDEKIRKMDEQRQSFDSPAMLFFLMFATAFVIGAIVTIISALTLRKNKPALA